MNEPMVETLVVGGIFAALLWVEWARQIPIVRLATVALALSALLGVEPNYTSVVRRVSVAPRAERITEFHGSPISDYESGVTTMYVGVTEESDMYEIVRLLAVGVLVWLACSPVLRARNGWRLRDPSTEERD